MIIVTGGAGFIGSNIVKGLNDRGRDDILVKGGDYKPEEVAGREYAGEVRIIDFEDGYSTTGIVEQIAQFVKEGKL